VSPANLRDHTPWSSESRKLKVFRSSLFFILLVCLLFAFPLFLDAEETIGMTPPDGVK
jgi:hypothetical protein